MSLFKIVDSKFITREYLLQEESKNVTALLSDVKFDSNGDFVSGYSKFTCDVADTYKEIIKDENVRNSIFSCKTILDLKNAIDKYIIDKLGNDYIIEESRKAVAEHFSRRCADPFEFYYDINMEIRWAVGSVRDVIQDEMRYEKYKMLWEEEFDYLVKKTTYDDGTVKISCTNLLDEKADIEHGFIDSESGIEWLRLLYTFKTDNYSDIWSSISEMCGDYGNLIQVSIIKEDDFHENPIHYMMGSCYDGNIIRERAGTYIVDYLIDLGYYFRKRELYNILKLVNKIYNHLDEIDKIRIDVVREYANKFVNILITNREFIMQYLNKFDLYMMNKYFCKIENRRYCQ